MNSCSGSPSPPRQSVHPFVQILKPLAVNFQGGYSPQELRRAYQIPGFADGAGQRIAVVAAYGHPNIAEDLAVFSRHFDLPDADLSVERAGALPEDINPDWALEIALDVEWAHALAPRAQLLLMLSPSSQMEDLMRAVERAASFGADVVSMSWGEDEFPEETDLNRVFQSRIETTFIAAAGDTGGVTVYPSASPQVISAGGTTLRLEEGGGRISETAWSSGGGGPSRYFGIPSFQQNMEGLPALTGGQRGTPDVSFCANPAYGAAVYSSVAYQGSYGWGIAGGTSLAAPCWAAISALIRQQTGSPFSADSLYRLAGGEVYRIPQPAFFDITQGISGQYQAAPGWDFCTGLGSPKADMLLGTGAGEGEEL